MKITDEVGQAKPEPANATRFIWWLFTFKYYDNLQGFMISEFNDTELFYSVCGEEKYARTNVIRIWNRTIRNNRDFHRHGVC